MLKRSLGQIIFLQFALTFERDTTNLRGTLATVPISTRPTEEPPQLRLQLIQYLSFAFYRSKFKKFEHLTRP
jgi:hypothetical protein